MSLRLNSEILRGCVALVVVLFGVGALAFKKKTIRNILLVALVLRLGLTLFHNFVFPLPDSQADAIMFETTARQWAKDGWGGLLSHWQSGALLYSWLLTVLYLAFGPSVLLAQALNVLLGTFIVYLVWRIASELFSERVAKIAGWIACLFPTLNLYSALTMREAPFVFLMLLGVCHAVRWAKTRAIRDFFLAVFFLVLATGLHLGAWPLIWALALWSAGLIGYRLTKEKIFDWKGVLELALVGGACAFIVLCRWGWDKEFVFAFGVGRTQQAYAIGRAAYLQNLVANNVFDLFWQVPIRIIYFLFTPFPWMVKEKIDLLGLADAFLYVAIAISVLYGLFVLYKRDRKVFWQGFFLLLLAAFGIAAFATITSNYGAAVRHRAKFVPMLAGLAAFGIVHASKLWRRK